MNTEVLIVFWIFMILGAFFLRIYFKGKKEDEKKIKEDLEELKKQLAQKNQEKD